MPDIQPFRAIRYDLGHVGSLSDVICPPYDVISPEFQDRLYKKHPANYIRLELNRDEPGDNDSSNRYTRAGRFLRNWQKEGVLFTEPDPAIYVYHQEFKYRGETYVRKGFLCRVRLERFGEGKIYPHEETMSGPKQDRLLLTRACSANLSPVFGLFPDPEEAVQHRLEAAAQAGTPLVAHDHLGVVHRMWPVSDVSILPVVSELMGPKPIFVADGHHRYETACNYRDEIAKQGKLDPNHPANFVLMACIAMSDPGLLVLPTHRLFQGIPPLSSDELAKKLAGCFKTRIAGEGSDLAESIWEEIESAGDQGSMAFYCQPDDRWVVATLTEDGKKRMAEVAPEHCEGWRSLGVALLHRLVMENLLGHKNLPKPEYVHLVEEVVQGIETGNFPLAALVMPATIDHIQVVSEAAERMPAKSTYFYPKLLSGLVINPLE